MTTTHANSPIKSCKTCAHCQYNSHMNGIYSKCAKYGFKHCENCIGDCQYRFWVAIPPRPRRRSFRQWLYEVIWE